MNIVLVKIMYSVSLPRTSSQLIIQPLCEWTFSFLYFHSVHRCWPAAKETAVSLSLELSWLFFSHHLWFSLCHNLLQHFHSFLYFLFLHVVTGYVWDATDCLCHPCRTLLLHVLWLCGLLPASCKSWSSSSCQSVKVKRGVSFGLPQAITPKTCSTTPLRQWPRGAHLRIRWGYMHNHGGG